MHVADNSTCLPDALTMPARGRVCLERSVVHHCLPTQFSVGIRYLLGAGAVAYAAATTSADDLKLAYMIPSRLARDVYTAALMVSGGNDWRGSEDLWQKCCAGTPRRPGVQASTGEPTPHGTRTHVDSTCMHVHGSSHRCHAGLGTKSLK